MSLLLSGQVEALQPVSCGIAHITNGSFNINNCIYSVKVVVFFFSSNGSSAINWLLPEAESVVSYVCISSVSELTENVL